MSLFQVGILIRLLQALQFHLVLHQMLVQHTFMGILSYLHQHLPILHLINLQVPHLVPQTLVRENNIHYQKDQVSQNVSIT